MRKIYSLFICIFVIVADQASKYFATLYLLAYQPKAVIPGFNFTLAYNTGAAFSFLDQAGSWHQIFFCIVSIIMSVGLIIWIIKKPLSNSHLTALSLILGGALGNLIDRFHYGHVIDFIDVYYSVYHWPVFNIADSAVCIGAILYVLTSSNKKY